MAESEALVMMPKLNKNGDGVVLDMHPLVLCKDCKMNNQCSIQFKFADADNPGDWFCADGERKEGR